MLEGRAIENVTFNKYSFHRKDFNKPQIKVHPSICSFSGNSAQKFCLEQEMHTVRGE